MDIILVDTSVWINFFKGRSTKASLFLRNNIENFSIATCPVIVQEVLQGVVNDQQFARLKNYFDGLTHLTGDSYSLANEAAEIYRQLRKKGVTIRKPNDCLIAAYSMLHQVMLLHDDKDFNFIAEHTQLSIF